MIRVELRVAREIGPAHPACSNRRDDFVRFDSRVRNQHSYFNAAGQFVTRLSGSEGSVSTGTGSSIRLPSGVK